MKNGPKNLAQRVEEYRLSREMTQLQAASLFRISLATYMRLQSTKSCSKITRAKIEKVLTQQSVAA
jgi:DNA-binding XRE family transcriptional regulator